MSSTRIKHFWYEVGGSGIHHAYDPDAKTTVCGVPVKPSMLGRSNAQAKVSERCPGCRLALSNG